jgi:hypothetical protein
LAVSRSGYTEVICPDCEQSFSAEIWPLVDVWERPDLAQRLQQGLLHIIPCPHCATRVAADTPLLVYRPYDKECPFLFSMPEDTSEETAKEAGAKLLGQLREALGNDWRRAWMRRQYQTVDRAELRVILNLDLVLIGRQILATEQGEHALEAGELPTVLQGLWAFLSAESWAAAHTVLDAYPELLDSQTLGVLEELIRAVALEQDKELVAMLSEHRDVLRRCSEVGVEAALAEAADREAQT